MPAVPPQAAAVPGSRGPAGPTVGTMLVVGLLALAVGLGVFAVWFQWGQTRRCLDFFGPVAARQIQSAPRVELWSLGVGDGRIFVLNSRDISTAPGLVHLRRGLVEDVNYRWPEPRSARDSDFGNAATPSPAAHPLPADAWDFALAFVAGETDAGSSATVLAFDLDGGGPDGGGVMTVVGRPGRLALGRMGPGLRNWIEATQAGFSPAKSGF